MTDQDRVTALAYLEKRLSDRISVYRAELTRIRHHHGQYARIDYYEGVTHGLSEARLLAHDALGLIERQRKNRNDNDS